jgi:hypothetical protein
VNSSRTDRLNDLTINHYDSSFHGPNDKGSKATKSHNRTENDEGEYVEKVVKSFFCTT